MIAIRFDETWKNDEKREQDFQLDDLARWIMNDQTNFCL